MDSAAGQALIGEAAYARWERKMHDAGLRGVEVHARMITTKGVRGAAHPTRSVMMPMIDGPGVLQYTMVEEDIPGTVDIELRGKAGSDDQSVHASSKQLFTCIAHQEDTARLM